MHRHPFHHFTGGHPVRKLCVRVQSDALILVLIVFQPMLRYKEHAGHYGSGHHLDAHMNAIRYLYFLITLFTAT